MTECGATFTNDKIGTVHVCAKEIGHDGKHQCALCHGQWVAPVTAQDPSWLTA